MLGALELSDGGYSMNPGLEVSRRRALPGIAAAACWGMHGILFAQTPTNDHDNRVSPPRPVPDVRVRCDDGKTVGLAALLRGRATALQFVFTECTTTCPIEGATFARVQQLVPDLTERSIHLLSLSIDPDADSPEALRKWLARYHARPGWIAATLLSGDVETIRSFFGDGAQAIANHSTRVQIINRRGEWIWRTFDLPSPESIADILQKIR